MSTDAHARPTRSLTEDASRDLGSFFSLPQTSLCPTEWKKKGNQGDQKAGQGNLRTFPGNTSLELRVSDSTSLILKFRIGIDSAYLRRFASEYGWALEDLDVLSGSRFESGARGRLVEEAVCGMLAYQLEQEKDQADKLRSLLVDLMEKLKGKSMSTYEGQQMKLNIVVDTQRSSKTHRMGHDEFLCKPWSPALGSSDDTAVIVEYQPRDEDLIVSEIAYTPRVSQAEPESEDDRVVAPLQCQGFRCRFTLGCQFRAPWRNHCCGSRSLPRTI